MTPTKFGGYCLATLLAIFTYFYGLDSPHIPNIGDEFPYAHITRLTADSGHLLPLQSQLNQMRNTKPPLLFWQGIASTHWGTDWTWWKLRYPSVVYTLLTALLVFLLARRLTQQTQSNHTTSSTETGFIAALIFLAFFSTFRYGRPFLVNPAETFWLFLPIFSLLYWEASAFKSKLLMPLLLGLFIGIGLLYKSFALVAPVGLALSWLYLHQRKYSLQNFLRDDALKIFTIISFALGIFALWFVFDPNPQAVWQEFIVGENAHKFNAQDGGYWQQFFWGGSSIWALLSGYPLNAGLLAFPVAALFWVTYQRRHLLSTTEQKLWIFLLSFFIVFSLPSQRTARYLLEAMPALAILCALNWQRLARATFLIGLLLSASFITLLAYLAYRLEHEIGHVYHFDLLLIFALTFTAILVGIVSARHTRNMLPLTAILTMLCLTIFLRPFDGTLGNFSLAAQNQVTGKAVWTPCNFRAVDEGYRFLLPGAQVHAYTTDAAPTLAELSAKYNFFIIQLRLNEPCTNCKIIGQRLEIRNRHTSEEIRRIFKGEVFQQLFVNEWLVETTNNTSAANLVEGCR